MYKVIKKIGLGLMVITGIGLIGLLILGLFKLLIIYPKIFGIILGTILLLGGAYAIGNDIEKHNK